jgi:hypothetical protein
MRRSLGLGIALCLCVAAISTAVYAGNSYGSTLYCSNESGQSSGFTIWWDESWLTDGYVNTSLWFWNGSGWTQQIAGSDHESGTSGNAQYGYTNPSGGTFAVTSAHWGDLWSETKYSESQQKVCS